MAGYIRQDTTNNIADGNIINASDFDNEYDAIEAAFNAVTGHTHDGTAAEGAPITKIGPTQDVVASASALTPKTTNTVDLGSSTLKYKDIYSSGTAYLTSLDLTNALAVSEGGTGATTFTANNVLLGNGTSAFQVVAPGTSGNVLTSDGTTWTSAPAPSVAQVYPGAGIAVSTGTAWGTSKTSPTGDIVGTSDTQTLTNKTIEAGSFTNGYTEEVYALGTSGSIALNPANGSIQTCALTGNPSFTDSLSAGQSVILMLTNGASYTVTWPTTTWVTAAGNAAPTLTAADTLVFWKVSTTLYGAVVGSYA